MRYARILIHRTLQKLYGDAGTFSVENVLQQGVRVHFLLPLATPPLQTVRP